MKDENTGARSESESERGEKVGVMERVHRSL